VGGERNSLDAYLKLMNIVEREIHFGWVVDGMMNITYFGPCIKTIIN
jgi:hypothetical protein